MKLNSTERLDAINILLMLLSAVLAIIIPFELFLVSYAIMGPLHYLTEISWLHDKNYYTKRKYDALLLMVIAVFITITSFNTYYDLQLEFPPAFNAYLMWIAVFASLLFVTVKNIFYRITVLMIVCVSVTLAGTDPLLIYLTGFLPTLIHVYVFTGLFMLYGALKSKSRLGLASVVILALCPLLLFYVLPGTSFTQLSEYGQRAYAGGDKLTGFLGLHAETLTRFSNYKTPGNASSQDIAGYWLNSTFHTRGGILLARFIAFAYTYHYLNWFSKTRIIQWHKVPKIRFVIVLIIWVASLGLYTINYTMAMEWLLILSYLHVLLELPLNMTSIVAVVKHIKKLVVKEKEIAVG